MPVLAAGTGRLLGTQPRCVQGGQLCTPGSGAAQGGSVLAQWASVDTRRPRHSSRAAAAKPRPRRGLSACPVGPPWRKRLLGHGGDPAVELTRHFRHLQPRGSSHCSGSPGAQYVTLTSAPRGRRGGPHRVGGAGSSPSSSDSGKFNPWRPVVDCPPHRETLRDAASEWKGPVTDLEVGVENPVPGKEGSLGQTCPPRGLSASQHPTLPSDSQGEGASEPGRTVFTLP